jgi:ADP-ribosylglycohydrolase
MHDVLDLRDLVLDEVEQLASSGYAVADLGARARLAAKADDLSQLASIEGALSGLHRPPGWPYEEPDGEETIREILSRLRPMRVDDSAVGACTRGAWLGRTIGNTMGKPVEGLSRAQVGAYMRAAGQATLTSYLPLLDPLPAGVPGLHASAPVATAGRFADVPRDDDLDWTILNLFLLERHGSDLTTAHVLEAWLDRLPFTQTYTAERAAYRNAIHGLRPPETATYRNPYREWIGALIRADAFGYVHPGDPAAAARLALTDARLSHVANGLYGELWAAALVATAFATDSAEAALSAAGAVVPPRSRLAKALDGVTELFASGVDQEAALDWIDETLGQYSWVHTLNNAAIIAAALLWGRTFMGAVGIAVAAGRDTDSTAATVGSVYGALHGAGAIPAELVGDTHVHVRSAVRDFDRITIDELTERTLRLSRRMSVAQPESGS